MEKIWAVVPSAGIGRRMNSDVKKQFIQLAGKEILVYTLEALSASEKIDGIIVAVCQEDISYCQELKDRYDLKKVQKIIPGGATRLESVYLGLLAVPSDCTIVVIHDGARPFVTPEQTEQTIEAARRTGAAVLGVPVTDTIKTVGPDGQIVNTPPRGQLYQAQTPQTFRYPAILEAYRHAVMMKDLSCTDDSQVVERYMDLPAVLIAGSYDNIKITRPRDLETAESVLRRRGLLP